MHWPERAGPLAHREAFDYLCELVRKDDDFVRNRNRLRRRLPWLKSVGFVSLSRWHAWTTRKGDPEKVLRLGLISNGADAAGADSFIAELPPLLARYGFDRIPLGPLFMIAMLADEALELGAFGDDPHAFNFTVSFFILTEDTRESFLRRAESQLQDA